MKKSVGYASCILKNHLSQKSEDSDICISPEVSDSSPFAGIKTLFDIKHDDIMQSLRETREEN